MEAVRNNGQVRRATEPTVPPPAFSSGRDQCGVHGPCAGFNEEDQFVNVMDGTEHEFQAPGRGDQRGQCPGLNAAGKFSCQQCSTSNANTHQSEPRFPSSKRRSDHRADPSWSSCCLQYGRRFIRCPSCHLHCTYWRSYRRDVVDRRFIPGLAWLAGTANRYPWQPQPIRRRRFHRQSTSTCTTSTCYCRALLTLRLG